MQELCILVQCSSKLDTWISYLILEIRFSDSLDVSRRVCLTLWVFAILHESPQFATSLLNSQRVSASLCESLRVSASLCESLRRRYRIISKTIVVQNEKNGRTLNPFITDNLAICTTTRAPTMHRIFFAEQLLFDPPFTLLDEFIGLKLDRIC